MPDLTKIVEVDPDPQDIPVPTCVWCKRPAPEWIPGTDGEKYHRRCWSARQRDV